jgi:hypothetical protein
MKKKIGTSKTMKKYDDGGGVTRTKTKEYSDNKNYVTKKVFKNDNLVKEKTKRSFKGFIGGAPSADNMERFAKDYNSLGKMKRGGLVKSKKK